jgi:hypothetical protein
MTQATDPTPFPLFPANSPERTYRTLQHQLQAAQTAFDNQHFLLCSGLLHAAAEMANHLHTHRPKPLYELHKPQTANAHNMHVNQRIVENDNRFLKPDLK